MFRGPRRHVPLREMLVNNRKPRDSLDHDPHIAEGGWFYGNRHWFYAGRWNPWWRHRKKPAARGPAAGSSLPYTGLDE